VPSFDRTATSERSVRSYDEQAPTRQSDASPSFVTASPCETAARDSFVLSQSSEKDEQRSLAHSRFSEKVASYSFFTSWSIGIDALFRFVPTWPCETRTRYRENDARFSQTDARYSFAHASFSLVRAPFRAAHPRAAVAMLALQTQFRRWDHAPPHRASRGALVRLVLDGAARLRRRSRCNAHRPMIDAHPPRPERKHDVAHAATPRDESGARASIATAALGCAAG
jgi:hypothetical protein